MGMQETPATPIHTTSHFTTNGHITPAESPQKLVIYKKQASIHLHQPDSQMLINTTTEQTESAESQLPPRPQNLENSTRIDLPISKKEYRSLSRRNSPCNLR